MNKKFLQPLSIIIFFSFVAFLYLRGITRDVYGGDIGDLVTAAYVRGVAHPPGYPLFTILGHLFSRLPIPWPPVSKVALVSTVFSFIGLIFFYKLCMKITRNVFLSLLSVSVLAFSHLFWFHAEVPEVFGLNNFFALVLLYYAILFYKEKKIRYFYLTAFFTGLSLSHHHTILFVLPGILLLLLKHVRFLLSDKRKLLYGFLCGLLGLAPYIYIPFAASANPVVNWDHADTLQNFLHLVFRKDYGSVPSIFHKTPLPIIATVVKNYIFSFPILFSYQIVAVFIVGVIYLLKKDRFLLIALLCSLLLSGPFFIFYGASYMTTVTAWGVIERFYVLSHMIFMVFVPYGFLAIKQFLDRRFSRRIYSYALIGYFVIVPLFMLKYNLPKTDLSKTRIGDTLARDILGQLPPKSVLFVSGDTTTFNVWYVRYVLNVRPDIDIVNPMGVAGNNYLDEEINIYHKKNPKVPLNQMLPKVVEDIHKKRRVFSTFQLNTIPLPSKFILIPKGHTYELLKKDSLPKEEEYLEEVEKNLRTIHVKRRETLTPAEENLIAPEVPLIYSNGLVNIGNFVDTHYKNPAKAEHYYRRALWIDDQNPSAYAGLALAQFKGFNDCRGAVESMKEAIAIYPIWEKYYIQLYTIYKRCKVDTKTREELRKEYQRLFDKDIEKLTSKI